MVAIPHVLVADEAEEVIGDTAIGSRDLDLVGTHEAILADGMQGEKYEQPDLPGPVRRMSTRWVVTKYSFPAATSSGARYGNPTLLGTRLSFVIIADFWITIEVKGFPDWSGDCATECMSSIKSVSQWRCRCGANIRVVTEGDAAKQGETTRVQCPRCGDSQVVYGVKVISVKDEPGNASSSN